MLLLDIYPHNSLDEVMSQIAEREVLKCLTYLALEQQACASANHAIMASILKQIYFSRSGSSGTVLFQRVFHRILFQAFIPLNVSTLYGLLH